MFSMAFSMILYGLLSKSQKLGSTDGFNVVTADVPGLLARRRQREDLGIRARRRIDFGVAIVLHRHLKSGMGYASEAVRDNEIRVEYLGVSAQRVMWWKYVIAAVLAALGGGIQALAPGMWAPRWPTGRPPVSSCSSPPRRNGARRRDHFRGDRSSSSSRRGCPDLAVHLADVPRHGAFVIIMFLPKGLWSLLGRARSAAPAQVPGGAKSGMSAMRSSKPRA